MIMDKIYSLAKRRGFIYPSSEIYGGIAGFWDYGPLGVELKKNIKNYWWKTMVYEREDIVGLDAAIIMNPRVWEVSGHTQSFTDPLVECKSCHNRFRSDKIKGICPSCSSSDFTSPKKFNLLTEVLLGVTEPKQIAYLRGEITQGVFVNFLNILNTNRIKLPFGIAQIGKAFRNEITPGNFTFRSREFEQMELEYFIYPKKKDGDKYFNYWLESRFNWYLSLGFRKENLRTRAHLPDERAHYARHAVDIEYNAPFGWSEFEGVHHRGDWDLSRHKLKYKDPNSGEEFYPWVIETSGGVDRTVLFLLIDSYKNDSERVWLAFRPFLAPVKIAVFPLVSNKKALVKKARDVYLQLKKVFHQVAWDDRGNIGKRYYSQDEIGTPFCITVDYQTLEDNTVTIRERDTKRQDRVSVKNLVSYFLKFFSPID